MVCTHWAMELRLGAQYSFMSFSLQEEGGWSVEGGGKGGGDVCWEDMCAETS